MARLPAAHLWLAPGLVLVVLQLKGQHICGPIHTAPLPVQLGDVGVVAHHQAELHGRCSKGQEEGRVRDQRWQQQDSHSRASHQPLHSAQLC